MKLLEHEKTNQIRQTLHEKNSKYQSAYFYQVGRNKTVKNANRNAKWILNKLRVHYAVRFAWCPREKFTKLKEIQI